MNDQANAPSLQHQVQLPVRSLDGRESTATLKIKTLSSRERITTALKRLGIFWGIAVVCVAIPMLHFILVPLFLLIGIGVFFMTYAQTQKVESLDGLCPSCEKPLGLKNLKYKVELKEYCPNCRRAVYVTLPSQKK